MTVTATPDPFIPVRKVPPGTAKAAFEAAFPPNEKYRRDPVSWVKDRLGEHVWSSQAEVAESVRDNRYTAVQSCHSSGKSFIASRIASWWLDVHPLGDAFVVTSAPTQTQVEAILWREIDRAHRKAGLPGYITKGSIPMWKVNGEIVGFGRKPADKVDPDAAMQAFQGIHAKYVLIILDEACGIPQWLFDAADSLATNDFCRVLAIGNPDVPTSHFRKVCMPGSGWNRIRISALDTPNFTGEWVPDELRHLLVGKTWVKERIKRWGRKSPRFVSKVLGLFPKVGEDTLISPELIERAQNHTTVNPDYNVVPRFGVDVADQGTDKTVIYRNHDGHVRLARLPTGGRCVWQGQDTMKTVGRVNVLLTYERGACAVVDAIGVGSGVVSRCQELELPVMPFVASQRPARPKKFSNRRSEQWWAVRELMEAGLIDLDPEDDDLAAQIGGIKWWTDSSGRIVVEPKKETMKRLGRKDESPDEADAFMMSTVPYSHKPPVNERRSDHRAETTPSALPDEIIEDTDIMELTL